MRQTKRRNEASFEQMRADPIGAFAAAKAQKAAQRAEAEQTRQLWLARESLWDAAAQKPDADALLQLGKELKKLEFLHWLKLWRLIVERRVVAFQPVDPTIEYDYAMVAIPLLTKACEGKRAAIEHTVNRVLREEVLTWSWVFHDVREFYRQVLYYGNVVATPHLTVMELVNALQGGIRGYSRTNVHQLVKTGKLLVEERTPGKARYFARYVHVDRAEQRRILDRLILKLK